MKKFVVALLAAFTAIAALASSAYVTNGVITITGYDYSAGAICSFKIAGYEYLDARDHGRCLQSASSFDNQGEAFNPTEAGAGVDGYMPHASTSLLQSWSAIGNVITTQNQMAFWAPKYIVGLAFPVRSNHIHKKTVTLNYLGKPNVIEYKISFTIPTNETHTLGQFEILTGYMPSEFSTFQYISTVDGLLYPLSDGPGEQDFPVILSTSDGAKAMGIWMPIKPPPGSGYGRWRFNDCVKWNVVDRVNYPAPGSTRNYRVFVVAGTRDQVRAGLIDLYLNEPHT